MEISGIHRSPRKSERHPVYVLNLSISPQDLDNCLEPAKASVQLQNPNAVSSVVSSLIQSFLVRHGFASERVSVPVTSSPSPRKKRKIGADANVPHNRPEARILDLRRLPPHLLYSSQVRFYPCSIVKHITNEMVRMRQVKILFGRTQVRARYLWLTREQVILILTTILSATVMNCNVSLLRGVLPRIPNA